MLFITNRRFTSNMRQLQGYNPIKLDDIWKINNLMLMFIIFISIYMALPIRRIINHCRHGKGEALMNHNKSFTDYSDLFPFHYDVINPMTHA